MIPKIIHFIWINFENELDENPTIPEDLLENVNTCKKINYDYEIKIWNGKECYDLVKKYFPDKYETFVNFTYPIMRCDMARLVILYVYGGIYCDMDRISVKSYNIILDKYREYDVIFSGIQKYMIKFINNDIIFSTKSNEFMLHCVKNVKECKTGISLYDVHCSSGSTYLLNEYNKYKSQYKMIIIYELNPCDFCNTCNKENTSNSISYSVFKGSWNTSFTKICVYLFCNIQYILFFIILIILLSLYVRYNGFHKKYKKLFTFKY